VQHQQQAALSQLMLAPGQCDNCPYLYLIICSSDTSILHDYGIQVGAVSCVRPAVCCVQVWSILSAQAELLGVLESEGQELVVAIGGRGGRGNASAPSNHHRPASRVRSDGQPGQEVSH
jgi:GTPase involved in cell partitioning and DNA repair